MRHRVQAKQPTSNMCFVCGRENSSSLGASFYELDNGELVGLFTGREEHQGYPGRLHGGIATAILDEAIGRAIAVPHGGMVWGVTVEVTTRFRKPIPLHTTLTVRCRITHEDSRFFEGTGELVLPDGGVAATAKGRYRRLPLEKIADGNLDNAGWEITPRPDDPTEIEL